MSVAAAPIAWPGRARCAASFSFDVDAESAMLAVSTAILDRGCDILEAVTGVRPAGYRAPMWELNWHSPKLLYGRGFPYDSSLMDADYPYQLRPRSTCATRVGSISQVPRSWSLHLLDRRCSEGWCASGPVNARIRLAARLDCFPRGWRVCRCSGRVFGLWRAAGRSGRS